MKHTLMADKKLTFFHRCEHYEMPPLEVADAIKGLRHPIFDAGGRIEDDALGLAASSGGVFPYKLEVGRLPPAGLLIEAPGDLPQGNRG